MQERKRFNLFRAIKEAFTPKNRRQESPTKHKPLEKSVRRRGTKKQKSFFSQMLKLKPGKKIYRKMARANAHQTNLKRVQYIGVVRRLAAMESVEKQFPGKYTKAIREHREWLVARK